MGNQSVISIEAVIDYIESHLDGKLELETVAEAVHYSKYHLHRLFTETVGMTIHDYVQRRQLTEAAKLLVFSDKPIIEIAFICGYESQQSFSLAFKAMYKSPPAEYREERSFYPLQLRFILHRRTTAMEFTIQDIRLAEKKDIADWMNLMRLVIDGYPVMDEDDYLAKLEESIDEKRALVLREGDILIGAMAFTYSPGSIEFLGVHPQYRNRGLQKLFLDALLETYLPGQEISTTTFAMLSLFLSLKLIYQRKLVQKVKKQIDFLIDRDTQTEIMVEKTDGTIQDLAASINHLLKKYRSMGQEIERSDTLFRDTITSLSHDLRTPLATANGYIQLLQEQDLTGEQKEYVTIAGERISAVKLLLDQLFEFARIEADELKLNCRNTDIHSVLRDVVASYYGDFEQKKCVPYIVIPNPPAIIWGDPNALTRIFSNVVYNALVHGEGNYQITAAIEEAQTVITIKNASSSIQQEDIPHLFDRFYTTDQSRTKKTTGLGLAIAQRLVTRMGGQIVASLQNGIFAIQVVFPIVNS